MKELRINERFESACPPLSADEFNRLESLILKDGVIINPILIWNDVIIDGHNRHQIAKKYGIEFTTKEISFASDEDAIIWIKENAISQRNLSDFTKYELVKEIEEILKEQGRKKQVQTLKQNENTRSVQMDKTDELHNTREKLHNKSGLSSGTIARAKVIDKEATEEVKEQLRKGETTIGKIYSDLRNKFEDQSPEIDILETAASSLERWTNRHSSDECLFEFIPAVSEILNKIRDKKTIYGK